VEKIAVILGYRLDCVVSDLAPRLSGIRDTDAARSVELARSALKLASRTLRTGGRLLIKTFQSPEADSLFAELKTNFASVQRARPEATRRGSSEIYLLAKGFKLRA
jgi:23S rRNA (uridine2552-2'-O)-methyltransferase